MIVSKMVNAATTQFKQNLMAFCQDVDLEQLTPKLAERMTQALSRALSHAGVAAYREFLLSYEEAQPSVEARGQRFGFKGVWEKKFLTPFGLMTVARRGFQNKDDSQTHVPLDAAWGMQDEFMTSEVREAVLFSCGHITPEETAQLLNKCALFHPTPTAIKQVVKRTGDFIETHRHEIDAGIRRHETVPENTRALVVSMDGATVLLNEKGKRFGRPSERPMGDTAKDTPTAYRTAMVGSISCYGPQKEGQTTPERLTSRYAARMPEMRWPAFKTQMEEELDAAERACSPGTAKILLMDGARELWAYVDQQPRYDGYAKLIDYWHAVEHLSMAAEALFGKGSAAGKAWYEKYRKILRDCDTGAHQLLRSMDYYAKRQPLSPPQRTALATQRTYFHRNKTRMTYAAFRRNDWPIGSGPVEAACKTLIKTRLCRSGMRWTRPGGQRILALRTYIKSKRWDNAWKNIERLKQAA